MVKDILGLHEQSDGAELVGVEQRWYNGRLTFLKVFTLVLGNSSRFIAPRRLGFGSRSFVVRGVFGS